MAKSLDAATDHSGQQASGTGDKRTVLYRMYVMHKTGRRRTFPCRRLSSQCADYQIEC
jgi:hypothetical protein